MEDGLVTNNLYLMWLLEHSGADENIIGTYEGLFRYLLNAPFIWKNRLDDCRAKDGLYLRDDFYEDTGKIGAEGPCTMLEMMVALAMRCERDIMYYSDIDDRTFEWFWSMVRSLGLERFTDEYLDYAAIDDILETFYGRKYRPDGFGSLFWIEGCEEDLRKCDIWHQMNRFLRKYYD